MPRLKERPIPYQRMQMLLKSYGMNGSQLAPIIGCSPPTARAKILDPRRLTLGDLAVISKVVGIPWDEIRQAMVVR